MSQPRNDSFGISRRQFLTASALGGSSLLLGNPLKSEPAEGKGEGNRKAQIAISLDLEMARNFPRWEDSQWDYEKGNLNTKTKNYAVEAARRVKAHGGVVHFFLVCQALEQENVKWLQEIIRSGHSVGNHTYDHVYIRATRPEEIQFRFARAPWLIAGKTSRQVIEENIRQANAALESRLGINAAGFRAPGGFADGLRDRPDLQKMLLDLGFKWVSTLYPAHPNSNPPGTEPTLEILDGIVKAQSVAQPFAYPSGLIEIPMSPISDVGAFRNGKWKLESFLKAIQLNLEWSIEKRAVFDFLAHPAVLYAMDPEFRTIELICKLVKQAGPAAEIVNLDTLALRASSPFSKSISTK